MNAAVVRTADQEVPRYEPFDLPAGDGPIVQVLAAGLSPRVRSGAAGKHYTSTGELPRVPGIDGVGTLDGRRVYFLAGDDRAGTMAETSRANPRSIVPLPDHVIPAEIAGGMIPAISSWIALTRRAPFVRGNSVLVLGASGTSGRLAVQIAKLLGAGQVIAAGRDVERLPDADVRCTFDQAAEQASEVDIVLDYVWGTVTSRLMPTLLARREAEHRAIHWVLIGSVAGDELALSSVLLRKRNLHILGSGQGASSPQELFGAIPAIVDAFGANQLQCAVREIPLRDVESVWTMNSRERVVLIP